MLKELEKFVNDGKNWLDYPIDWWGTKRIDYHHPYVDRMWQEEEDIRYYLHIIHNAGNQPCLFHKHKWPSAIYIIHGSYEMGIAYDELLDGSVPEELTIASKIVMVPGSAYEMINPHALHYVRPITDYSLSLMVSGKPYEENIKEQTNGVVLGELNKFTIDAMVNAFKEHWPKEKVNLFV